jgi:CspA family cold shock protein
MNSDTDTHSQRLTGKVKWFNNKAGYGFITVHDEGVNKNNDIFVHFTAVRVTNSQYKYLVQGEYVEFDLVKSESGPHEYKAMSVTGIKGGELMCETRNVSHQSSGTRKTPSRSTSNTASDENNADGFTSVNNKRSSRT